MLLASLLLNLTLSCPSSGRAAEGSGADFQVITVQPGDTLWSIANAYLKDPQRWNELLPYNKELGSDPTVALPGIALRVPTSMVKPALRAAYLSYMENEVFYRARDKKDWVKARLHMPLYPDDSLRTGSISRARIKFPQGSVLNLDSNSIVLIKPQSEPGGVDLKLVQGKLRALHVSLKAHDATIAPRTNDTIYEAAIKDDGSAKVEVYSGNADVRANGQNIGVDRGFSVEVPLGLTPALPQKMTEAAAPEEKAAAVRRTNSPERPPSPAAATNLGHFDVDFRSLPPGATLGGFRVQASKDSAFKDVTFDQLYEADEEINFRKVGLPSGIYWWRVAPVDLLGVPGKFSEPKKQPLE